MKRLYFFQYINSNEASQKTAISQSQFFIVKKSPQSHFHVIKFFLRNLNRFIMNGNNRKVMKRLKGKFIMRICKLL